MKKIIAFVLCALMLTAMFVPAAAAEYSEETIYFDDGSYLEFSDKIIPIKPSGSSGDFNETVGDEAESDESQSSSISSFLSRLVEWFKDIITRLSRTKTVTKTKYANYYSSKGEALWSVYLTAEFKYNGRKAVCTSSSISFRIIDSDWKLIYSSRSEQDNTAVGNFVVKQYKLGVPLKEVEGTLTLTCDKNGNVK
ncbi:MAG: hypothetical protein IJW86_10795 [Clostridia bacterium]|nr:hypothetical protein [Clostridia bacterium]MBQ7296658.1 hypothetical protein [Clostridia bacterium]